MANLVRVVIILDLYLYNVMSLHQNDLEDEHYNANKYYSHVIIHNEFIVANSLRLHCSTEQ